MQKIILFLMFSLFAANISSAAPTLGPKATQPGDLKVIVVASKSDQYLKDWVDPAMQNKVTIQRVKSIKPEQTAYCGIIITGLTPTPNPHNVMQYSVNYRLIDPDGNILFDVPNYTRGQFKNPGKPTLEMADPTLDLVLEESDIVGMYKLEGTVTDLVTGNTATDFYEITLVKESAF